MRSSIAEGGGEGREGNKRCTCRSGGGGEGREKKGRGGSERGGVGEEQQAVRAGWKLMCTLKAQLISVEVQTKNYYFLV